MYGRHPILESNTALLAVDVIVLDKQMYIGIALGFTIVIVAPSGCVSGPSVSSQSALKCDQTVEGVARDTSVFSDSLHSIRFPMNGDFLPAAYQKMTKVRPLSSAMYATAREAVVGAYGRLSSDARSLVERIYIVSRIDINGSFAAGTWFDRSIVVSLTPYWQESLQRENVMLAIFHESSSVILRQCSRAFEEHLWRQCNPTAFEYDNDEDKYAMSADVALESSDQTLAMGFICPYGMSTLENDFNMFSERLFAGDFRLWVWATQYDRIYRKLELLLAFWGRVDSKMDRSYFQNLCKSEKYVIVNGALLAENELGSTPVERKKPVRPNAR
jgi:hypothetical protein